MSNEKSVIDSSEEVIFDPCRQKYVPLTPEEKVRQWFLGLLHETALIPLTLIGTEVPLSLGDKDFRADILVYEKNSLRPWILVECKRPEVKIDERVLVQAKGYNIHLGADIIILTNGSKTVIYDVLKGHSISWKDFLGFLHIIS